MTYIAMLQAMREVPAYATWLAYGTWLYVGGVLACYPSLRSRAGTAHSVLQRWGAR